MLLALNELTKYRNWIAYTLVFPECPAPRKVPHALDGGGRAIADNPECPAPLKLLKIPYNPNTGGRAMANNPSTWSTYDAALKFATERAAAQGLILGLNSGVGFMFSNSPFAGIDLDHCFNDNGDLTEWGRDIVEIMNSYTEYSPSGRGLHILFKGEILPEFVEMKKQGAKVGNVEMYYGGRFFTVTGKPYGEAKPIIDASKRAEKVFRKYLIKTANENSKFPPLSPTVEAKKENDRRPKSGGLLEVMFNNPKNGGEIQRLYSGDISGYHSHSEADLALCNHLAFYTHNDAGEMDMLFRQSGLMRNKWNEMHGGQTYGEMTIEKAITGTNIKQSEFQAANENEQAARKRFEHETVSYSLDNFMKAVSKNHDRQGISTGFENLDSILDGGFYPGLYVIGANSSIGKTTFALQMADNIARAGHGVLIFSLEMATNELIAKTLSRLSLIKSIDEYKSTVYARTTRNVLLGHYRNEYDTEIISQAIQEYREWGQNIHITEGIGNVGLSHVTEKVKEWIKFKVKPPVVVIDYLQILAPYSVKMTDKQNVDRNITELKRLSRDYDIPVIGISSFNRESYSAPVSMASFKESGAIEYSSDVLIGMQYKGYDYQEGETDGARMKRLREINRAMEQAARECSSQDIQVKILKNRNGVKGGLSFDFFPAFNYFRAKIDRHSL